MIKRTFFFLPQGISIIIATVIGNTMAQQCVATKKISKYHSTSITVVYNVIYQSRLLETSKKKTQHLKKLAKFYAHKSKKYQGKMGNNLSINLDIKSF